MTDAREPEFQDGFDVIGHCAREAPELGRETRGYDHLDGATIFL